MTSLVRVACVGAGYFSQFHYESWSRIERVELVGSCNRDISRAQATGLPAFDDLRKMIEHTQPDLLDIILPPIVHAQMIRVALDAGIKTLICQKPFCQNKAEAEAVTTEAEAAGARIIVHENFRFQPWYRALKSAIEAQRIGDVHQLTFRLRPGDGQGPDAYLDRQPYFQKMDRFLVHETAVHWVDTFRYLLGNPIAVYADLRKMNPVISGEDAGYILFDHANGRRSVFDGNRHLDHASDNHRRTMGEALVEGTSGTITLRGDGSLRLRQFGATEETNLLAPDTWNGFGGDCVHGLQKHVISGLLDNTPLENSAREYLRVIDIEDAIYSSAATGQKVSLE
ncbi:Gfo/Idh/MocA family protein [Shimia abyssi]|uniref:Putative dehydrogenase n=1 Tax=Shimia abyssi TaxID=1662395 RepID=A0A2P8FF98_9RHOB|nr:Gfo/Idh/MocA family oxidoreductase [Shimia abyssi]PSL20364.1 putative dehydrogenase [Shimia abyssi]